MIAPHCIAQCLHCTELQLLDGAFAASQLLGNFAHAFAVDEAALNHQALIVGQALHKLEEHGPPFYLIASTRVLLERVAVGRDFDLLCIALPSVGQCIGRDPQEPRRERYASPLKSPKVSERLMKDLGRDVLGFGAVVDSPRHKGIDTVEVALVQLRETARIVLGRFNQEPLIGQIGNSVQSYAPGEPTSFAFCLSNPAAGPKGYGALSGILEEHW